MALIKEEKRMDQLEVGEIILVGPMSEHLVRSVNPRGNAIALETFNTLSGLSDLVIGHKSMVVAVVYDN